MANQLRDRLEAARRRQFVGRDEEIALFRSMLASSESAPSLLYIYGPGGIGKSALLRAFRAEAEQAGALVIYLQADLVDGAPRTLWAELREALDLEEDASALTALQALEARAVLLIDPNAELGALEGWLRERFLPGLPASALVVVTSRTPPSSRWRSQPGWQSLMQVIGLRNLAPQEAEQYLVRRAVPREKREAAVALTHGYPLALSLLADAYAERPDLTFSLEETPDLLTLLLERFLENVPGPAHRSALEAAALVRVLNEGLLEALLEMPDVHDLFNWLTKLSLVEIHASGLSVHRLPRAVIDSNLRWRNPDWHELLSRRAREYYQRRVQDSSGKAQRKALKDHIYLHRNNAIIRPFFSHLQETTAGGGRRLGRSHARG